MSAEPQRNPEEIGERLKSLRLLRFVCHFPWLMVIILGIAYALLPENGRASIATAYEVFFVWAAAGFFLSYLLRRYPCPRCSARFHYRRPGERFLSLYPYNDFAAKCTHCGLRLDGGNI